MEKRFKLMIVEDDEFYGELLKYVFKVANVDIYKIKSGEECIEKFGWWSPDVMILDHNLGLGINGLETLKILKSNKSNCEVIVLTNNNDSEVLEDYTNLGIYKLINKSDRPIVNLLNHVYDVLDKLK